MWQYNDTNELYHYGVLGMRYKEEDTGHAAQ